MIKGMAEVAKECFRHPRRASYWSPSQRKYICPDADEAESASALRDVVDRPALRGNFKMIFLAAFGGTILFTLICVACHIATDGKPPVALQKLIDGLFDMAKIGFGAVVGLLGAKAG